MTGIPASILAQWAALSDFVDPPTRCWGIVIMTVILGTACTAIVGARLWLRTVVQRKRDTSDWFSLVALIFTLAFMINTCVGVKVLGMDHHIYDLTTDQTVTILKFTFSQSLLDNCCGASVRISVILFYRQLIKNYPSALFSFLIWVTIGVVGLLFVGTTLLCFLNCQPLAAFWMSYNSTWATSNSWSCLEQGEPIVIITVMWLLLDLVIVFMPTPLIWRLRMPLRQKILVWTLFTIGILASAARALRLYAVVIAFYKSYDFTWNIYWVFVWTCVEYSLAIICSSAPALKALTKHAVESRQSSKATSNMSMEDNMLMPHTSRFHPHPFEALLRPKSLTVRPWRWCLPIYGAEKSQSDAGSDTDIEGAQPSVNDELDDIAREIRKLRVRNQGWGPCTLSTQGFGYSEPNKPRRGRVGGGFGEGHRDLVMVPALQDGEIVVEKTVELVVCETKEESEDIRPQFKRLESWEADIPAEVGGQAKKRPQMKRWDSWHERCVDCGEGYAGGSRERRPSTWSGCPP